MIKYRGFKNYYEGENEGDGNDDGNQDDPATAATEAAKKAEDAKKLADQNKGQQFTQEQVNRFLADERRKAQKINEKTVAQLEALRKNASLTEQEKINLEERIDTLRNEFLTKEELTKKEQQKEANKRKEELANIAKEKDKWKKLYEDSTVENTLLGAASSDPDVFNPNQILELLKPKTRLIEELDEEGKPTGRSIPRVKLAGRNKDGESIMLELDAVAAVKQLKENTTEYGNLFKSNVVKGVGGNNNGDQKKGGGPPEDPAAFREWRKKNPNYLLNI